ncbi:hypothetical protein BDW22DRAFT_498107 [Trametopsis cervina]|nr:hypothetical protein BDW22DRAFT_498107 [Trametopsis cervina]
MQSPHLKLLIEAGALLAGSSRSDGAPKLEDVLRSRLVQYYQHLGREGPNTLSTSLDNLQTQTAHESLWVLEEVQLHLAGKHGSGTEQREDSPNEEELVGTRDIGYLRTLLSIYFKWAIEPWLQRVCASIPTTAPGARRRTEVSIIDLTTVPDDYQNLKLGILRLIHLILPGGVQGAPNATVLSSVILDKHLSDLFKPCLVLGWLPKSLASESVSPLGELRPLVVRLMHMLPVSKCITALSAILSDMVTLPYVRRSCSYLMSRQLLRQDGVRGLFLALFWDDEESEESAPLEKLEQVGRVLQTVPTGMDPSLLALLSSQRDVSPSHRRVAAFALSRLLSRDNNPHQSVVSRIVLPAIHKPLLQVDQGLDTEDLTDSATTLSPAAALDTLQTLLTNTDPSPTLISGIMTPIVPSLYSLWYSLDKIKSADPAMRAILKGILGAWGRLVGSAEGTATLWLIIDGEGGNWQVDIAGEIRRVESSTGSNSLSLFTPEDLRRAEQSGEFDMDANLLDLRPDPVHFVGFLKSLARPEVVSEIFVRLLDAYRESKGAADTDPLRTLLYLQLVVQIQNQASTGDSSVNILKKPDHILAFVKHALDTSQTKAPEPSAPERKEQKGLGLKDLRITEEVEEDVEDDDLDEADSDDEDGDNNAAESGEELTTTAFDLLLSILEANPELSTENAPILNEIFFLLEKFTRADSSSEALKSLAREARMVLIARLASSSAASSSRPKANTDEETPSDTYQKALKLLQDPLLPVRAHGLLLLRQLVSSRRPSQSDSELRQPVVDRALIPGILSIFLQSLQDDDSYIFLNAVQGLAAMVDGFGKEVLKGIVDLHAQGLDGIGASTLTKQDVDTRTRMGEALGQVIRRCGDALPKYIDQIAPPLIGVMRSSHLPTALRVSSISLLALSTDTSALAVLPWATDLFSAMLDLLQLESVQASQAPRQKVPTAPPAEKDNEEGEQSTPKPAAGYDSAEFTPTTKDAKIPILRRSALHLITLLTRAFASQLDDPAGAAKSVYVLPGELMRRAKTTVAYVAATDADVVVCAMARETGEELDALAEDMLSL